MSTVLVIREEPKPPTIKEVVLTVSEDQARLIWAYTYRTAGFGKWRRAAEDLRQRLSETGLTTPIRGGSEPHAFYDRVFEGSTHLITTQEI